MNCSPPGSSVRGILQARIPHSILLLILLSRNHYIEDGKKESFFFKALVLLFIVFFSRISRIELQICITKSVIGSLTCKYEVFSILIFMKIKNQSVEIKSMEFSENVYMII